MDITVLLRGIILGIGIAAPVGPIGIMCIRRTLSGGRCAGIVSGMGAATADAVYGSIAAAGLTMITSALTAHTTLLRIGGGLFLCYLGIATFRARPAERSAVVATTSLLAAYTSTLVLTLTNPLTILSFAAIFAGVGSVA